MAFRESSMTCPRCGVPLAQYDDRDKWRCNGCLGTLVGIAELEREIGAHAAAAFEVTATEGETNRKCPVCAATMAPFSLGDIELERCDLSEVLWFDPGEAKRRPHDDPGSGRPGAPTDELGQARAEREPETVRALPAPDDPGRFTEAMRRLAELGQVRRRF